jgi:hypothetical protein
MGSRRIAKTRSLSSYLTSLDNSALSSALQINANNSIATNSIGENSIAEEMQIFDKSIQSGNYVEGYSGWKITGTGNAEFGNVVVRGNINASSGSIGYWNISNPAVTRVIGSTTLLGTFLESAIAGDTDDGITSGTYVGLFKSYSPDAVQISTKERVSNIATLTSEGHDFQVGDKVIVTLDDDTTFNNSGTSVTITAITLNTFSYANSGTDVSSSDAVGIAELDNDDVAGLYLRDYGKNEFDYGYFSNKGIAYVSARKINTVKNPSFEFFNQSTGNTTATLSAWTSSSLANAAVSLIGFNTVLANTATATTAYYDSQSSAAAYVYAAASAPSSSEYLVASIDYAEGEKFTAFSGGKSLTFGFDMFANYTKTPITISSATYSGGYITVNTGSAHGYSAGQTVFINASLYDTNGVDHAANSNTDVWGAIETSYSYDVYSGTEGYLDYPDNTEPWLPVGRAFTVVDAPTSTSFRYTPVSTPTGGLTVKYPGDDPISYISKIESSSLTKTMTVSFESVSLNKFETGDQAAISGIVSTDAPTLYNSTVTVLTSSGNSFTALDPTYKQVTNRVVSAVNVATLTVASHGYLVNQTVLIEGVDKAVTTASYSVTGTIMTINTSAAHLIVVGELFSITPDPDSPLADLENYDWTATTGTTGTVLKFDLTENAMEGTHPAVGLTTLTTDSVLPRCFDGEVVITAVATNTFNYAITRNATLATAAVTDATSVIIGGPYYNLLGGSLGIGRRPNKSVYRAFSLAYDLTNIKIQYGSNVSAVEDLSNVISTSDLSTWAQNKYRTTTADKYLLARFKRAPSPAKIGQLEPFTAGARSTITIDGKKIYSSYASLNPTGQAALEDIKILFPAKISSINVDGTYSTSGGHISNSAATYSGAAVGYLLDNVYLSTSADYFDGNSGVSEFLWSGTGTSANAASLKESKHWLDINLDDQTSRIDVDFIGINETNFTKKLFSSPRIGNIDTSDISLELPSLFSATNGASNSADLSTIGVLSGDYLVSSNGYQYTYAKSGLVAFTGVDYAGFELLARKNIVSPSDPSGEDVTVAPVGIAGRTYYTGGGYDTSSAGVIPSSGVLSVLDLFGDQVAFITESPSKNSIVFDSTYANFGSARVRLDSTHDVTLTSTMHPLQLGADGATHMKLDANDIQVVSDTNTGASFYLNYNGGSIVLGNTTVGLGKIDGTSDYVWANGVYGNTLSTSYRSVYVSSSGTYDQLGYVASSRRFKKNIEPLSYTAEQILSVRAVEYHYNEEEDTAPKHAGMIAEEMHDAGLHAFISYDKEGLPETIQYEFYVTALQQVVRDQAQKLADLTARLEILESR